MAIVKVEKNSYTVDSIYQWDKNQDLVIYGLSLATIPEIHFTNDAMDRAIVRQATMDDAGIITVDIPNSLLQKPNTIKTYVCVYEGETFESLYSLIIPVKARKKPGDYTIEDTDGEIYSFNALENLVKNTVTNITIQNAEFEKNLTAKYNATDKKVDNALSDIEVVKTDVEKRMGEAENTVGGYDNRVTELETKGLKRADVVDNLLSESADLPLSANQGKILDDKVTELNSNMCKNELSSKVTIANNEYFTPDSDGYIGMNMDYDSTNSYCRVLDKNNNVLLQLASGTNTRIGSSVISMFLRKGTTILFDSNKSAGCYCYFYPLV